jgi:hypothetical protein
MRSGDKGGQKTMSTEAITKGTQDKWIPLPWKSGIVPNCVTAKVAASILNSEYRVRARQETKEHMQAALAESFKVIFWGQMPEHLELSIFSFEKTLGNGDLEMKLYAGVFAATRETASVGDLVLPIKLGLKTPKQIDDPANKAIRILFAQRSPVGAPPESSKHLSYKIFQRRTISIEGQRLVFYDRTR